MTNEQLAVVETVLSNDSNEQIIAVQAVAGAGKTSTSVEIAKAFKPNRGFYTAFNRGIVKESASKFRTLLEAKTMHAFAHKYINPSAPGELTYDMITESISYPEKKQIITHLDNFFRSSYTTYDEYFENIELLPQTEDLIVKYANKMYTGTIPSTYNYWLKCLHLMLDEGSINPKYDLFILDECQDTTPVVLEIFKLINAKKKVMLGDRHQNIYSFLNTVNGFKLLDDTINLRLTKSFRCCESVARQVEKFGKLAFGSDFIFTGNEQLKETTSTDKVYLNLTNSDLIVRMYELWQTGQGFVSTRTIDEIFALPFSIVFVASGKTATDPRYRFLEHEKRKWEANKGNRSFFYHLDSLGLEEVTGAISTLKKFNDLKINIFQLKEAVKKVRPDKNIVLSTAHSFKGLERPTAIIEKPLTMKASKIEDNEEEMNNLYYVALSRAMYKLEYL